MLDNVGPKAQRFVENRPRHCPEPLLSPGPGGVQRRQSCPGKCFGHRPILVRVARVRKDVPANLTGAVGRSQVTELFDPAQDGRRLQGVDRGDRLGSDPQQHTAFQWPRNLWASRFAQFADSVASHSCATASKLSRARCRFPASGPSGRCSGRCSGRGASRLRHAAYGRASAIARSRCRANCVFAFRGSGTSSTCPWCRAGRIRRTGRGYRRAYGTSCGVEPIGWRRR